MNILQMHQRATKKANIYYHRFLTKYKKNEKRIYVFCEANEDFGYYVHAISKSYPDLMIGKVFVEGNDNVLALHSFINWNIFHQNFKYIMAAVAISLESTGQHLAKNIEKNKIIKIESDTVWSEKIAEKEFYSIRGKWDITFLVKLLEYDMNNSRRYVSSLYTGSIKEPKRLCEITPDKAMVILAPHMKVAKTLQEFCNVYILWYLENFN